LYYIEKNGKMFFYYSNNKSHSLQDKLEMSKMCFTNVFYFTFFVCISFWRSWRSCCSVAFLIAASNITCQQRGFLFVFSLKPISFAKSANACEAVVRHLEFMGFKSPFMCLTSFKNIAYPLTSLWIVNGLNSQLVLTLGIQSNFFLIIRKHYLIRQSIKNLIWANRIMNVKFKHTLHKFLKK